MSTVYSFQDREMQRLRSLVNVFQKTDRILLGDRSIKVHLATEAEADALGNPPGWSQYPNIYINHAKFDSFKSARTLVQLLGLNYHEVAHLLFTPRKVDVPHGCMDAWNILEDQRIESFFTAMYGPSGKYFTEMVIRFYVEQPEMWESAFALTYGRSFMPLEIREAFEERFALPNLIDEVKELIDRYKTFRAYHFRSKKSAVAAVVRRFQEILNELQGETGQETGSGCGQPQQQDGNVDEDREKQSQQKERRRREKEDDTGEDQSGFWDEDDDEESEDGDDSGESEEQGDDEGEGDEGDGDSDGESDEESDDGAGAGGDDEDSDTGDSDADGDGSGDSDSDTDDGDDEDGEGSGGSDGSTGDDDESEDGEDDDEGSAQGYGGGGIFEDDQEFSDYLDDVIDAVNEDDAVQNEVATIKNAMVDPTNIDVMDFDDEPFVELPITDTAAQTIKKVGVEIQRLYAQVEPGWNYGSDVGKLNIDRAMRDPENYEEMFDEWDEGREQENGLEVVMALDMSISMDMGTWSMQRRVGTGRTSGFGDSGDLLTPACEAFWIIKRALDDVDAKVTTLGFHETIVGLFSRDQKAPTGYMPRFSRLGGDTQPAHTFTLARRILSQSPMPNKLFVILTDGQWSQHDSERQVWVDLEDEIDTIPGHKMYVGFGDDAEDANVKVQEHFQTHVNLRDAAQLVALVEKTVTGMLMERRR